MKSASRAPILIARKRSATQIKDIHSLPLSKGRIPIKIQNKSQIKVPRYIWLLYRGGTLACSDVNGPQTSPETNTIYTAKKKRADQSNLEQTRVGIRLSSSFHHSLSHDKPNTNQIHKTKSLKGEEDKHIGRRLKSKTAI